MKRRYGIFIIVTIFLVSGIMVGLVNHYYTFPYLYRYLIKREFSVNPKVPVSPTRKYQVKIWYYPFFRNIEGEEEKEFFRELARNVAQIFPNIQLVIRELSFREGPLILKEAFSTGEAPDIYLNLENDSLHDRKWQLPLESFLSKEELAGIYVWEQNRGRKGTIWGWPLLIHRQFWLANGAISLPEQGDFFERTAHLPKESLVLNFADPTLLKQLLSLKGLNKLVDENGKLSGPTYSKFEQVFVWLHQLRQKQIFAVPSTTMEDLFLKSFFSEQRVLIGPVNPFLERFLFDQGKAQYNKVYLDQLVEVYTLNIFRQKKYQGDDHTRAVLEVARILAQNHGCRLAEELKLGRPLTQDGHPFPPTAFKRMLEITPDNREFWQETVIPVWLDFWQKGLTPQEVMERLS